MQFMGCSLSIIMDILMAIQGINDEESPNSY